jgi:hypothetical protein
MFKQRRRLLTRAGGVMLAVLAIVVAAGGVVLAQASQDFDLGCRSELTAGGTSTDYAAAGVRLHSSVGLWNAGRTQVQGSGILIHSGYILPTGQGAASAAAVSSGGVSPAEAQANAEVYVPLLWAEKVLRFVRPCNWPWASVSAVQVAE